MGTSGISAQNRTSVGALNDEINTRSCMAWRLMQSATTCSTPSLCGDSALISTLTNNRLPTVSNTSSSVGIVTPLNCGENQLPASSAFNSLKVMAVTRPVPLVVSSTLK